MYEHVNGEAELLKRYGAQSLVYASYEGEGEAFLTVDMLDMGAPVNAFGLYSLYAGCDGDQYSASGGIVLSGDYTSYVILGSYFMRIDSEAPGGPAGSAPLVKAFLAELSKVLPTPEALPGAVGRLKKLARRPCEVGYHPENIDYDLEAGPGYSWTGPDGAVYFLAFLPSGSEAGEYAAGLLGKGARGVVVWKNAVAWPRAPRPGSESYLRKALPEIVK